MALEDRKPDWLYEPDEAEGDENSGLDWSVLDDPREGKAKRPESFEDTLDAMMAGTLRLESLSYLLYLKQTYFEGRDSNMQAVLNEQGRLIAALRENFNRVNWHRMRIKRNG